MLEGLTPTEDVLSRQEGACAAGEQKCQAGVPFGVGGWGQNLPCLKRDLELSSKSGGKPMLGLWRQVKETGCTEETQLPSHGCF